MADANTGGTAADPVLAAIGDVKKSLDNAATKADLDAINSDLNTLKAQVKEIKVGDANSTKAKYAGFDHAGAFLLAAYDAVENPHAMDERLKALKASVNKGASNPTGASTLDFPLPAGFNSQLNATDYKQENLPALCRSVPIDEGQQSIELTYFDDTDRSGGTIYGGILAYTKAEAEQMSGTKPKKRHIRLEPQEIYAYAVATEKLLRNNPFGYGEWLKDGMNKAIVFKKNDLVVNGTGAAQPRGLLNSPDKITVSKESSQAANTITHRNVAKMWKRVPANWRAGAIWLANQDIEDVLDQMARQGIKNDGTTVEGVDGPAMPAYNAERQTIYGRPLVFSEFCPSLSTEGDLILWVPGKYLVASKVGQGMEESIHLKFDTAERAFRVIVEFDGKSEYPAALTPYKGSTTRSSIVTLQSR